MRLSLNPALSLRLSHQHRLAHRVKLANIMSLPEVSFSELVQQVEKNPLFQIYRNSSNPRDYLFQYQRFPRTGISTRFLEINDSVTPAPNSPHETDRFLEDKREIVRLCQKIGMDNFKSFFLYNDQGISTEDISHACKLPQEGVRKIQELIDRLALDEEFTYASRHLNPEAHEHYTKIADIEKDTSGEFIANYVSLRYGKGRYVIDYKKFEELKNSPNHSKEEIRYLQDLINTMELINARKSVIYQTLEKITERQRSFLANQDPGQLNSLTQLELAREMEVHSSSISRAIQGKSIGMPWGEEIPIKFFFVRGPVHKIKAAIYMIVDSEEKRIQNRTLISPYRDDEIKNLLLAEYRMETAVRTVAKYRSELGIPNVYNRANSYHKKPRYFSEESTSIPA